MAEKRWGTCRSVALAVGQVVDQSRQWKQRYRATGAGPTAAKEPKCEAAKLAVF